MTVVEYSVAIGNSSTSDKYYPTKFSFHFSDQKTKDFQRDDNHHAQAITLEKQIQATHVHTAKTRKKKRS